MDISLLEWVQTGGLVAALLAFIYGGYKELWVFGTHYKRLEQDRDFWRDAALKGLDMTSGAMELAERRRNNR